MRSRNRRDSQQPQPPRGEFWLLLTITVMIATIALLHLAVERERAGGDFQFDLQLLSATPTTPAHGPEATLRLPQDIR